MLSNGLHCIFYDPLVALAHSSCGEINDLPLCCCCCCYAVAQSCMTLRPPWTAAGQASLSFTTSQGLLKLMSIELMMPSNLLILCRPLLLLLSFPASGSFPMSRLFASGCQRTGASASASVLPKNIQGWFPLGLTGLISLLSKGLSRVFSNTTVQKHQFFSAQLSLWSDSHIQKWLLEKSLLWLYGPLLAKWYL